jgi:hypothetical protein
MVDAALKPAGPVDVAVIAFDEPKFNGAVASAIADLVRAGTVRLLDAIMIHKAEDGTITLAEITDIDGDGIPDLIALQGDIPGLIGEDDATSVVSEMPNDSAVLMLAWENTWALRVAQAIRANGGQVVALERIAAADVEAVLAADEN